MSGPRKDGRRLTSPNLPGCWNPTVPSPTASRGFRQKPVSSRRKHIHHWYKSLAGGSRCACEAWRCEFAEGLHQCEVAYEQGRKHCPTHRGVPFDECERNPAIQNRDGILQINSSGFSPARRMFPRSRSNITLIKRVRSSHSKEESGKLRSGRVRENWGRFPNLLFT
jgi:hypothetical protein